jgi:hypothetical protein
MALAPNTSGFVADLDLIAALAQVEYLTQAVNQEEPGVRYDLIAAYGDWSGFTLSSKTPHIALIINTRTPPLDDPLIAGIVRRSIDPQAVVDTLAIPGAAADAAEVSPPALLRTELANLGRPDGLEVGLAYAYTPGIGQIADQLQAAGIESRVFALTADETRRLFDANRLNLALVSWTTADERQTWVTRAGEINVIDLYLLPISYRAVPDLTISISPGGWPLPTR